MENIRNAGIFKFAASKKKKIELMEIEKTFIPKETESKFKKILKHLISDYYKQVIEREKEIISF